MLPPIRCFTCNNILGHIYPKLNEDDNEDIFKKYNINRYCCRRMLLSCVDITQWTNTYPTKNTQIDPTTMMCVVQKPGRRLSTM